jgi:PKD repeat protein
VTNKNRPPKLDKIKDKTIDEGQKLEFTISAADPDNDNLYYSATYDTPEPPKGASFDAATRTFIWTPSYTQAGTYKVMFTVSDGELSDSETITITVNNVNRPPVLDPIGNKSTNENQKLEFIVSATDPDNDPLEYSAPDLPQGASFDEKTQTFTWTPSYDQQGTYNVTFTVDDGELSDSETIHIKVTNKNRPPKLDKIKDKTIDEGQKLEFTVSAADPDGDALTYSASGLPQGASFDANTHAFSWISSYDQAGEHKVTFIVSDDQLSDSKTINIKVNNINRPPVIKHVADYTVSEGDTLTFNINVSDPDKEDRLTTTLTGVPDGAGFVNNVFKWTPDYNQSGVYVLVLVCSDGKANAKQEFKVTVSDAIKPPVQEEKKDTQLVAGYIIVNQRPYSVTQTQKIQALKEAVLSVTPVAPVVPESPIVPDIAPDTIPPAAETPGEPCKEKTSVAQCAAVNFIANNDQNGRPKQICVLNEKGTVVTNYAVKQYRSLIKLSGDDNSAIFVFLDRDKDIVKRIKIKAGSPDAYNKIRGELEDIVTFLLGYELNKK